MTVYLLSFLASITAFYLSWKNKDKKASAILLVVIGLIIPCLIAGLRDRTIGTDVQVYTERLYSASTNSSSIEKYQESGWNVGWRIKRVSEYEIGFSTLIFIVTKMTHSLAAVLFIVQLLTIVPIYFGLKNLYDDEKKICVGMLVYLLMFFCTSLNLMRQMIGVAICFYGISLILRKKRNYRAAIIMVFVASLFHKTSIAALAPIAIHKILNSKIRRIKIGNKTVSVMPIILALVLIIGGVVMFSPGVAMMLLEGGGYGRYSGYIGDSIGFSVKQLIVRIPLIIFLVVGFKKNRTDVRSGYFYIIMAIIDALLANAATVSIYGSRLSMIFQIFYVASVPFAINKSQIAKTGGLRLTCIILYFMLYWYITFVIYNVGQVVPYIISL